MDMTAPDEQLSGLLARARHVAFKDSQAAGKVIFDRAVAGLDISRCDVPMLSQLVWTGLACNDTDFINAALDTVYQRNPPIRVTIGEPPRIAGGPQAILCTAGADGLHFIIPFNKIRISGLNLMASRFVKTLPMFVECVRAGLATEGQIILNIADAARTPGVGYCANIDTVGLIPDPDYMASRGYADFMTHLNANPVPWAERKKVAFWRGATTGHGDGTEPRWQGLHRVKLCQAVQGDHAALFDVGISRLQLPDDDPGNEEIKNRGYMKPYVVSTEFYKYRYQIDIDGYTSAWSALFQKLATGSTVLKVASRDGWRQWYYDKLKPWENFVPVLADLSDLVEKTRWLIEHDEEAERIGQAGRALALSLTYDSQVHEGAKMIAEWMGRKLALKPRRGMGKGKGGKLKALRQKRLG